MVMVLLLARSSTCWFISPLVCWLIFSLAWAGAMQMCGAAPCPGQHRRNMTANCFPMLTCHLHMQTWDHRLARAGRRPLTMASHKRNFQCFNAVGGDGSHRSFLPSIKHHTSRLPRIPHHGMVAHHEPLEGCYLCSEYRHAHALEAVEIQTTPLYHSHTPCLHHHPHQYVPSRPTGPDGHPLVHSGHHIHHRHNKKVMLVKNSNPSFRRTIILHRRSLRSFGLFLEEVSELMQYHIRKLYTLEGRKVR